MAKRPTDVPRDPALAPVRDVVAPVSELNAYDLVAKLLSGSPPSITKVGMSSDAGETIRLRPHTYFEAEALRQKLEDLTSIDQLLELEHELMIQIERLEVVERMVEPAADAAATRQQIRETLRLKEQQAQSMFTALLKTVKEADRDMEIQVRSFEAFLKEAKIEQKPGVGQYLFVLNADPNDLMRNPKLAERFPDLSGIGQVRLRIDAPRAANHG